MKMLKGLTRWLKFFGFGVIFLLFVLSSNLSAVQAQSTRTPPQFPACRDRIFSQPGDWAHYDFGIHGIPGIGNLEGRDDVYSLPEGNFLQCYCPVTSADYPNGIQTDWWDVDIAGLTDDEINYFVSQGWIFEPNGSGWNLLDDRYLARNSTFSCTPPTSTPTPTPTPGPQSKCYDLEAQPSEGTVPLTVKFIAHADDPSQGGKIKEYRFDFGDASGGQPQVWFQTDPVAYHRYELPGEYTASLRIQDFAGNWRESDDCKVKIKANPAPQVLAAQISKELPVTGFGIVSLVLILPFGLFLYRRFRLL